MEVNVLGKYYPCTANFIFGVYVMVLNGRHARLSIHIMQMLFVHNCVARTWHKSFPSPKMSVSKMSVLYRRCDAYAFWTFARIIVYDCNTRLWCFGASRLVFRLLWQSFACVANALQSIACIFRNTNLYFYCNFHHGACEVWSLRPARHFSISTLSLSAWADEQFARLKLILFSYYAVRFYFYFSQSMQ